MVASGVCGTDLKLVEGKISGASDGVIMGHESVGDIVEVGANVDSALYPIGSRVVMQPNIVCGNCPKCDKYQGINDNFCDNHSAYGIIVDGGLSEYAKFNKRNVRRIPEEFTSISSALIEPIACLLHGFWRIEAAVAEVRQPKFLVIGAGMIGLLWCRIFQCEGYSDIFCTDQSEERMKIAENLGVKTVKSSDLSGNNHDDTYDVIIDCTGYAPCLTLAVEKVAKGGTILVFGCCAEKAVTEVRPFQLYEKEVRIMGSIIYETEKEFDHAIEYVWKMEQKGLLNLDDFKIGKYGYHDVEEGWEKLMKKEIPKLILIQ
ncbi:D-altritol 5-dehydrogenase-like isoform X2 [Symsagittifera roscoffensis]